MHITQKSINKILFRGKLMTLGVLRWGFLAGSGVVRLFEWKSFRIVDVIECKQNCTTVL